MSKSTRSRSRSPIASCSHQSESADDVVASGSGTTSIENPSLAKQPKKFEFFFNLTDLLKICQDNPNLNP